ncbi:MAG: glycosyltransferase family 4 protein [Planctomycetota bacterium]
MSVAAAVAFDGGIFDDSRPGGVQIAFLEALSGYGEAFPGSARLLVPPGARLPDLPGIDVIETTCVQGPIAREFRLPGLLRRLRSRIYHSPVAAICGATPLPIVATIHDLPWANADLPRENGHGLRHRRAFTRAMRRAAAVIVPSNATADDARTLLPRHAAKLHVIHHGIALPKVFDPAPHLGPFLTLGDDRPRKNLEHIVRGHALATARDSSLPPLLQVGPRRESSAARVVDESGKRHELSRARALLQVSLHEGFGLPVVEAMGHGTPVIVSKRGSLPEIGGDAAIAIDARDLEALADALTRLWRDEEEWRRRSRLGRQRAAHFTPERTARAWHAVHRELGGG